MWNEEILELLMTSIPQSFAIMLIFFSLIDIKIEKKFYPLFSIIFSIVPFVVRPEVNFGVHSVISMLALVLIAVLWAKANVIKTILYSIITFGAAYLSELIVFLFLIVIKFDMSLIDTNSAIRIIIAAFSILIMFAIGLAILNIKKKNRKKDKNNDTV